jgi:hypothetical protein
MVFHVYSINGCLWLLIVIILMTIGDCFTNGYW